jgi:hypothetical protein
MKCPVMNEEQTALANISLLNRHPSNALPPLKLNLLDTQLREFGNW